MHKIVLENERVRLLEVRMMPGDSSAMHSHPDYVIYPLSDATLTFTSVGGESVERDLKAGEPSWRAAEVHAVDNRGTVEARLLLIELK